MTDPRSASSKMEHTQQAGYYISTACGDIFAVSKEDYDDLRKRKLEGEYGVFVIYPNTEREVIISTRDVVSLQRTMPLNVRKAGDK
jgi:hypothetical protein